MYVPHTESERLKPFRPMRNLVERFVLGQAHILAILDHLTIPFDNIQAEGDLRMFTVKQKMSSAFRVDRGAVSRARDGLRRSSSPSRFRLNFRIPR